MSLRIAPTPSGYLHIGNGANFLFTWAIAKILNKKLFLRIDDLDSTRVREEYIQDIFNVLDCLKIDFEIDCSFENRQAISQSRRINKYKQYLSMIESDSCYFCQCTRSEIKARTNISYDGYCRSKEYTSGNLRLKSQLFNDFIIVNKKSIPVYNFACTVDDSLDKISVLVRGSDLYECSIIQDFLREQMSLPRIKKQIFHKLMTENNLKINKSDLSKPRDVSFEVFGKQCYKSLSIILDCKQNICNQSDLISFLQNKLIGDQLCL